MTTDVIVVDQRSDWAEDRPGPTVIPVREYLTQPQFQKSEHIRLINLCRDYEYLSTGYYCSLLAEARGHRVIPRVRTLLDLSRKSIYSLDTQDLDRVVQKTFGKRQEHTASFALNIFFGQCEDTHLRDLARQLFDLFPCPILKVEFRHQTRWEIGHIEAGSVRQLTAGEQEAFSSGLHSFVGKRWRGPKLRESYKYDLAILHNPGEQLPPSNKRALQQFAKVGKTLGVNVELIERKDYSRLAEYDGLFIRETTRLNDHTYRFSKKAESEGMVVIDDPDSILKCTNKVYLAELLKTHDIPAPKTAIVPRGSKLNLQGKIPFPVVLKIPDGSFSRGTHKADNQHQLEEIGRQMFRDSDVILAQEFVYTEFDWRIGILNRKPIFACQYFMTRKHWQVIKHSDKGRPVFGDSRTLLIEDAPVEVVHTALRAAALVGDGLYGVDLKQNQDGVYVIEINDNPNLDAGVEDLCLKDRLYRSVLEEFVRRLDARHQGPSVLPAQAPMEQRAQRDAHGGAHQRLAQTRRS